MGATATMLCGDTVSLILSRMSAATRWSGQTRWIWATRLGWASAAAAAIKQVWKAAPIVRASCTRRIPSSRQRPWACRWRRRRSLAASLICGLLELVISFIQLSGAQATYLERGRRRHREIGAYRMLTVLRSQRSPAPGRPSRRRTKPDKKAETAVSAICTLNCQPTGRPLRQCVQSAKRQGLDQFKWLFANSANALNPSASLAAMSANTLRSTCTSAFLSP